MDYFDTGFLFIPMFFSFFIFIVIAFMVFAFVVLLKFNKYLNIKLKEYKNKNNF